MSSVSEINNLNLQVVCDAFGVGALERYEVITEGVLNLNYKVYTSKGVYFAKGVRGEKQDSISLIYEVEETMRNSGIPAITMLQTQTGEIFSEVDGQKFTLYPFVESDRSHTYTIEDYGYMGQMLAQIHLVSKNPIPLSSKLGTLKNNNIDNIKEILNSYRDRILIKDVQDETDTMFLEYINLKLKILGTIKDFPEIIKHQQHILHGDYHAGNLLIDKNSRKIIGVCDWEKSEIGSRAYEIARSIMFLFEDFEKEIFKIKEFVSGYMSIYPISKQELIEGFTFRTAALVKSKWMENLYYNLNTSRANNFIEKDIERICFFAPLVTGGDKNDFFDMLL